MNEETAITRKRIRFRVLFALLITGGFVFCAMLLAAYIENNLIAQSLVQQFGLTGIVVLAIIGGFNVIVPVPAATFVPIFIESGFQMPTIILGLVIGTTIADTMGYMIGRYGKHFTESKYPRIHKNVENIVEKHQKLILPSVFFYSAFVPFPNEAILLPLGFAGSRFRYLVLPLILGTIINQTALAYGFSSVFAVLF